MLSKENTGLIIVDIQGKLARTVSESDALITQCRKLIQGAQALSLPIIWLEQNPEKLGNTVEELSELLTEQAPIEKFTFDGCVEPKFINAVKSAARKSWLICGIEAHICVYQTASNLQGRGYDVSLVSDCVSSRDEQNKQLAIDNLKLQGVGITGLEMCLYELVKDCREPEFKDILRLVK